MHNSWKIKTKKDDPGISRGQNKTLQLLRWIMLGCVLPHIIEEYLTYSTVQKITKKDSPGLLPRLRSFSCLSIWSLFILPYNRSLIDQKRSMKFLRLCFRVSFWRAAFVVSKVVPSSLTAITLVKAVVR